ncbi:Protein CutA, chloroplastic [Porphyridium purpureum]|uniref:Protein CutA, chloroplastic n=1 Tax=Porphyridium purpureum TaxID=35688 RepID=A0A5J4YH88_PORPP|nr:Protein CutA, chloroplastic [Porphyridium purpureum]|eukprot:POR6393..scf251_18
MLGAFASACASVSASASRLHAAWRSHSLKAAGGRYLKRVQPARAMATAKSNGQEEGGTRCVVYVTAPNESVAQSIASELVHYRLAACVNVIPGIKSTYLWAGKVETDQELLLMIKTRRELVNTLTERVVQLHPYDCPEVIEVPIVGGFQNYLKWIDASTIQASDKIQGAGE